MSAPRRRIRDRPLRLRLFVAGQAPNSLAAARNLEAALAGLAPLAAKLEVVDVLLHPEQAARAGVIVTPTLLRVSPGPPRRIIGNLSDRDALLAVLVPAGPGHE